MDIQSIHFVVIYLFIFGHKVYIAEVVPARLRGMLGSVNQLAVTLGLVLSYTTGAYVPWRWLALVGAIPPALLALLMFFMPETPRWSIGKNRQSEASAALQWLRGLDADIEREASTIKQTLGEHCNSHCVPILLADIHGPHKACTHLRKS